MKLKITSRSERERGREKERGGGDRQRVSTQSFEHGSGHARKSTMCAHSLLSPPLPFKGSRGTNARTIQPLIDCSLPHLHKHKTKNPNFDTALSN